MHSSGQDTNLDEHGNEQDKRDDFRRDPPFQCRRLLLGVRKLADRHLKFDGLVVEENLTSNLALGCHLHGQANRLVWVTKHLAHEHSN